MINKESTTSLRCEPEVEQNVFQSFDAKILLMLNQICLWKHRAKTRKVLASLNYERLQDIGLSAKQVQAEISKPFWK